MKNISLHCSSRSEIVLVRLFVVRNRLSCSWCHLRLWLAVSCVLRFTPRPCRAARCWLDVVPVSFGHLNCITLFSWSYVSPVLVARELYSEQFSQVVAIICKSVVGCLTCLPVLWVMKKSHSAHILVNRPHLLFPFVPVLWKFLQILKAQLVSDCTILDFQNSSSKNSRNCAETYSQKVAVCIIAAIDSFSCIFVQVTFPVLRIASSSGTDLNSQTFASSLFMYWNCQFLLMIRYWSDCQLL